MAPIHARYTLSNASCHVWRCHLHQKPTCMHLKIATVSVGVIQDASGWSAAQPPPSSRSGNGGMMRHIPNLTTLEMERWKGSKNWDHAVGCCGV